MSRAESFKFSDLKLETIRQLHDRFAKERNWGQFHQPKNILLALIGELGEIAEHFQWKPDDNCRRGLPEWPEKDRNALAEELSDVLVYLIRLADRCQLDLTQILSERCNLKMQIKMD